MSSTKMFYVVLSLYMGNYIGFMGGIFQKTNQEGIIQWDCLKTDFYHQPAYPTFLYYNPHADAKKIEIMTGTGKKKLYDAVTKKIIRENITGKTTFTLPGQSAAVIVVIPDGEPVTKTNGRTMAGDIIIDYCP